MTEQPKFDMKSQPSSVDLDSLIDGGADTAPKPGPIKPVQKKAAAKKPVAKKAAPRAQLSPPWEDAGEGKKQLPLFLPERSKEQLDFLRETTGVSTQRLLRDLLIDAIEKRANDEWEG